jgi:hypothetical protein
MALNEQVAILTKDNKAEMSRIKCILFIELKYYMNSGIKTQHDSMCSYHIAKSWNRAFTNG